MTITVPFRLRGVAGAVRVTVAVNEDPKRWGWHLLGVDVPLDDVAGFPVVEATVDHSAEGYAAIMGWVQVVRYVASDEPNPIVLADVAPQLRDSDMPYLAFGVRPTLFDSPAISAPDASWQACAFLTVSPDALMTRTVAPVCGFRWGYERSDRRTTLLPVHVASRRDWEASVGELRTRYPNWTWVDTFADEDAAPA